MKSGRTLLRLAEAQVREHQRALAVLAQRDAALANDIAAIDEAVAREMHGAMDAEEAAAFAAYAARMRGHRRVFEQQRAALAQQERAVREALAEAFLEQKKFETLIEAAEAREAVEEARAENAELDEIAARRR